MLPPLCLNPGMVLNWWLDLPGFLWAWQNKDKKVQSWFYWTRESCVSWLPSGGSTGSFCHLHSGPAQLWQAAFLSQSASTMRMVLLLLSWLAAGNQFRGEALPPSGQDRVGQSFSKTETRRKEINKAKDNPVDLWHFPQPTTHPSFSQFLNPSHACTIR